MLGQHCHSQNSVHLRRPVNSPNELARSTIQSRNNKLFSFKSSAIQHKTQTACSKYPTTAKGTNVGNMNYRGASIPPINKVKMV